MITRHKRREPAFTIVELIIVITVIAMLAGMTISVNAPTSNKKSMNIASFNTVVVPANGISPQTPVYTCQSYVLTPGASTTCTGSFVITPNYSPSPGINFSINYSPV